MMVTRRALLQTFSGGIAAGIADPQSLWAQPAEGTNKGMLFPDIVYRTTDGETRSIADARGKLVLVYLWASWCPICAQDLKHIQAYYDRFKESPRFSAIILNFMDPYDRGVKWAEGLGFKLPFANSNIASRNPVAATTRGTYTLPRYTPLFYILDGNGVVLEATAAQQNADRNIPRMIESVIGSLQKS